MTHLLPIFPQRGYRVKPTRNRTPGRQLLPLHGRGRARSLDDGILVQRRGQSWVCHTGVTQSRLDPPVTPTLPKDQRHRIRHSVRGCDKAQGSIPTNDDGRRLMTTAEGCDAYANITEEKLFIFAALGPISPSSCPFLVPILGNTIVSLWIPAPKVSTEVSTGDKRRGRNSNCGFIK